MEEVGRTTSAATPRLEDYDVHALVAESLAMPTCCDSRICVAPTVRLLAQLLGEAQREIDSLRPHVEGIGYAG